jgi:hypothetical protein
MNDEYRRMRRSVSLARLASKSCIKMIRNRVISLPYRVAGNPLFGQLVFENSVYVLQSESLGGFHTGLQDLGTFSIVFVAEILARLLRSRCGPF